MTTNYNKKNPNKRSKSQQRKRDNEAKQCKFDDRGRHDFDNGDINDPSYYIYDANLRAQLPNISFNEFVNVPVEYGWTPSTNTPVSNTFPTCMRINLNPSAGVTDDNYMSSGVNLAALSMYTKLSANNAKTSAYAPQDITTLLFAISELIAISSHIARAFGVCRLYNYRNRAFPESVVKYLGVDYDDLIKNFSDYRSLYNNLMVAASKIPIPANITLFQKSSKLYSNVYLDMEGSSMAQIYVFVPDTTWFLNEQYSDQGTGLSTMEFNYSENSSGFTTMNTLLARLDTMISHLLNSSTLNAIYSDILRLADKEGLPLYTFTTIDDSYVVTPIYNPEIRSWINNLVIVGSPINAPGGTFTPDNDVVPVAGSNSISYKPRFKSRSNYALHPVLNFDHQNVTGDEIIEATRLSACWRTVVEEESVNYMELVTLPDHYVTSVAIYGSGSAAVQEYPFRTSSDPITFTLRWSNFDWAPFIYVINANGSALGIYGDTNYYTTIDYEFLKRLNDASYQGLLELR